MWFNVYKNGDSQEFHNHARSHVSCIYVAEGQKDDSRIFFNCSPVPMFPIPIRNSNDWNYDQVWFPSEKGLLIIFKSWLDKLLELSPLPNNFCLIWI